MTRSAGVLAAIAFLLPLLARTARADAEPPADLAAFTATLDALVAQERVGGGWAFAPGPDGRPHAYTEVMRIAEWLGATVGLARWDLLVVRSPGTPAAGSLLLEGHRLTGRPAYLHAARRAGEILLATQLPSGGWFSEVPVEGGRMPAWFPVVAVRTTLDDDVTPGTARFLLALSERTGDARFREGAERAIDLLLAAQLPSGAWPHVWRPEWLRAVRASREDRPSLNDGLVPLIIETLLAAAEPLGSPELVEAARHGGEWLLARQRLPPRAGWAQQYNDAGEPAGMRPFEPPALASWETRHAIDALDALARATGETRWCAGALAAAAWLRGAAVRPGCWARFYGLDDGQPLFFDAGGRRVTSPAGARPGYDWQGDFGIAALLRRMGMGEGDAPPAPLPGDPGACQGVSNPFDQAPGPRGTIARAGRQLAVVAPPPVSPCAGGALHAEAPEPAGAAGASARDPG